MLRIKNWDEIYENSRSRIIKDCRWVPIPNKQDGLGYSRLVTGHGNGAAHYGVWVAIVCLCSRQTMPRQGYLTDDGTEVGRPLTTLDISLVTRLSEVDIKEALPRFVEIGWMSNNLNDMVPYGNEAALQSHSKEGNRIEGNRIEQKEEEPLTAYEQKIETYFDTKIDRGMIIAWHNAHPAISVDAEILKAKAWLFANQDKKQYSRFGRFLGNWMSSAANPPEWMREKGEESTPEQIQICKVCGAEATKTIDEHGSYCTNHSPWD